MIPQMHAMTQGGMGAENTQNKEENKTVKDYTKANTYPPKIQNCKKAKNPPKKEQNGHKHKKHIKWQRHKVTPTNTDEKCIK